MSQVWFLQANPKLYDIDGALTKLAEIWWRVPQRTHEVRANDIAVMWRSGDDAGIVGVGRIVSDPQEHPFDAAEQPFHLGPIESTDETTRVLVRVRPSTFISKSTVAALDGFAEHQIVVTPRGTVFPITAEQWATLEPLLPTVFAATSGINPDLPPPFSWLQKTKGVAPMTGGYSGYLKTLRLVCDVVDSERPTPLELPRRLEELLSVSITGARQRASFLRKVGIVDEHAGTCRLGNWAFHWRDTDDPRLVVALLHSRCQFIGELLMEAVAPRSTEELLAAAGQYGLGWDTQTQINNRRGWLQSAGMLVPTADGKLQTTGPGRALLEEISVYEPSTVFRSEQMPSPVVEAPANENAPPGDSDAVDILVDELRAASTDSANPNRLEQATREVFAYLGFEAEWLGGAGRTDVLLDAALGKDESYRVIIDCKSSAADKVGDQQIDWTTLSEHREKHDADYVAVVAPSPSGNRLFERAIQYGVTVISTEQLAGICRLHEKTPLGLGDYRDLFTSPGDVDTHGVDERADEVRRLMLLAAATCRVIRAESQAFGRFSARDVLLMLRDDPAIDSASEEELQLLLHTLASPLLNVLDGSEQRGYLVSSSPAVFEMRLRAVASALGTSAAKS